jgi:nitrogen fixation protein FixH
MPNDPFANDPARSARQRARKPREITGRMVLAMMVAFFAVVIGVNVFMAHEALSTFGGVEIESSYQAGQKFERDVAMAKAQDDRHWQVDAKVSTGANGAALLDITARDATGAPLAGLSATALFARPTDRRLDRAVTVSEDTSGHFRGSADIAAGQWDLVIELSRQGERVFLSKNRVMIR